MSINCCKLAIQANSSHSHLIEFCWKSRNICFEQKFIKFMRDLGYFFYLLHLSMNMLHPENIQNMHAFSVVLPKCLVSCTKKMLKFKPHCTWSCVYNLHVEVLEKVLRFKNIRRKYKMNEKEEAKHIVIEKQQSDKEGEERTKGDEKRSSSKKQRDREKK